MTMVSSGPIDLRGTATSGGRNRSIDFEFGYGAALAAYRGVLYTNPSGTNVFPFPKAPFSLRFSDFYNTRKIPSGSANYTSNGTFTVPAYNVLNIIIRAAGGQGAGDRGINACVTPAIATPGGAGTTGGTSQFGVSPAPVFGTAPGGGGGGDGGGVGTTQAGFGYGGNTSNAGGAGAGSGGPGGGGGVTVLSYTNPLAGGSGPVSGTSVSVVVGVDVAAQNGGNNYGIVPYFGCVYLSRAGDGAAGGAGSVSVSWS